MKGRTLKGYLFAIISAVIYGCMPLMAKLIYADGVNPMSLVFLRNALALPSLAILALTQQKTLKVPLKILPSIGLLSFFGCTLTPILLFSSYNYIASGTATIFHFIYPAVIVVAGILFLKKKEPVSNIISVFLCFAGVALFYDPAEPLNLTGCAFALGSGITFATYVMLLPRFSTGNITGFLFSFYVALGSSISAFILCIATGSLTLPATALGWGLCLLFAVAVTSGAVVLFQQGAFIIGAEKTAILSTLEPITGVVIGILVFHESVQPGTVIGCILVISASLLIALADLKKPQ